jgi:hypothetical protein
MQKAHDGIRAKARKDGYQTVHFEENPGHWIATPETDRARAIAWAKRNRNRLINRADHSLAFYCKDFYLPEGQWVKRQRDKGHTYSDVHLASRQAYLNNYFMPAFGERIPADIDGGAFRREFDDWLP